MVTIAVDLGARSPGNLAPFHHPGQFGHPRGFVLNGGLDVFLEAVGTVVAENTIFNTPGVSLYCLPTHHLKEQIRAAAHRRKDYCPEQRNPAEIRALFGAHPGFRPVHAKGAMLNGFFTPSPDAAKLSRAPHFNRPSTPTTVRFSNSTGIPVIPDNDPNADPLGCAVRFHLAE